MTDVITRLRSHPLHLTHYERAMLFGGGDLSFRQGAAPVSFDTNPKSYKKKQRSPVYGAVRELATRVIRGDFPNMDYGDIAIAERARRKAAGLPDIMFDDESLKNTCWKLRNGWKAKSARRRAAA